MSVSAAADELDGEPGPDVGSDRLAPLERVPFVPWPQVEAKLVREWEPGQHVTLVGPTGSGKTHLAITLLDLCRYRLVLATKRQDPLVSSLRAHGYTVTGNLSDVQWAVQDSGRREPIQRRIVFWPRFAEKLDTRARMAAQAHAMSRAIDWADKTGGWAVLVDETIWMHKNLMLEKELSALWFQGRTQGLSVIACAQRPSHVPRLAWTQASYFFIWSTQDRNDLISLREMSSGFPRELVEETVRGLDYHSFECLFVDTRNRQLARTIAPPR